MPIVKKGRFLGAPVTGKVRDGSTSSPKPGGDVRAGTATPGTVGKNPREL